MKCFFTIPKKTCLNKDLRSGLLTVMLLALFTVSATAGNFSLSSPALHTSGTSVREKALADIVVSGKVVDSKGEELIGVSVKIKGTNKGVSTDAMGNFKISAPETGTLVFSYVGYELREVAVKGERTLRVVMKESSSQLNEVVVVGYGTVKKRDLTGSVTSIGAADLKKIPVSSTAEAIKGRMAGVQVQSTEGSPDAEISIRVRGGGSISQDNSPLYIVDGFPVSNITNISPTDIQSIDILKDASSAAIYGARGANGVFIITTKSGTEGKISVNVNSYAGIRNISNYMKVLDPYEYVYYQYELDQTETFQKYYGSFADLDIYKSVKGTNWQKEVFGRTAFQQNHNVSISGGSKSTKFNLGLTRSDEDAIMIGSGFQRNNVNFKLNTELNKYINIDFISRFAYTSIDGAGTSAGSGANTRLRNTVKYAPTKGLRQFSSNIEDDLSSAESASLLFNPVESTNDEYKNQTRLATNFSAAINWKPINNLVIRTEGGYDFGRNRTDQVWGPATSNAKELGGQPLARLNPSESESWRVANTATYDIKKLFPGHSFNVMLGQEIVSYTGKSITNESRFFPVDMDAESVLAMMNLGTAIPTITNILQPNNISSFFGRINYSGRDRYLASFTFRADGSSKFAEGNRWGYFPSGSLAWRISEEDFMRSQKSWLSNLKLRGSVGMAGNNRIDDGLWQLMYSTDNQNKPYYPNESEASQLIPGSRLGNPDLKWETTFSRNIGLDLGLFNGRLNAVIDVYKNTTKDLLIDAPVPTSTGYASQMQNIGQTSNKGIEIALDGAVVKSKDFNLNAGFNIAFNKNKVDKFRNGDINYKTYTSGWNGSAAPVGDFIIQEGKPVGQMYGYLTDGMYSFDDFTFDASAKRWVLKQGQPDNSNITSAGSYFGPGALKFRKVDGSGGTFTEADKVIIGDANPLFTGGFNVAANYKGFDFSVFCNFSYGNDVYNANKLDYTAQLLSRKYQNLSDEMSLSNRFTTIDPVTGYNIYYGTYANPARLQELNQNASIWHPIMTATPLHSWAIEDGSFLRVNNVTFGYTFPDKLIKRAMIQNLRIYVTAYNLYTFTSYSGFDPEVSTRRSTPMTPGVDYSAYPKSRQFVAGINVTF